MSPQVPTVAKVRYLEGALRVLEQCLIMPRADPAVVREWAYQAEIVKAMIADYKEVQKNLAKAGLSEDENNENSR